MQRAKSPRYLRFFSFMILITTVCFPDFFAAVRSVASRSCFGNIAYQYGFLCFHIFLDVSTVFFPIRYAVGGTRLAFYFPSTLSLLFRSGRKDSMISLFAI